MSVEVDISDRKAWIWINRPEVRNAIDENTAIQMRKEIVALSSDKSLRVLILSGRGGHFCAGAELKRNQGVNGIKHSMETRIRTIYQGIILAIRECPKPVISAVQGYAVGFGCDIALSCDLRIAGRSARFSEIFVNVALVPDGGGSYSLPKIVGLTRALELLFTGRMVSADEAERIGLVNALVSDEHFVEEVNEFVSQIEEKSPLSLERIKRAVYSSYEGSFYDALVREARMQAECLKTEDFKEGLRAFFERRKPEFKGC